MATEMGSRARNSGAIRRRGWWLPRAQPDDRGSAALVRGPIRYSTSVGADVLPCRSLQAGRELCKLVSERLRALGIPGNFALVSAA